jgi:hypothetical protein
MRAIAPIQSTYGLRSHDILTSQSFGLTTDRNPEVEEFIQEYFSLFQNPQRSPQQKAQLVELQTRLAGYNIQGLASQRADEAAPVVLSDEQRDAIYRRLGSATVAKE